MRIVLLLVSLSFMICPVAADLPVIEVSAKESSAKEIPGVAKMDAFSNAQGLIRFRIVNLSPEPKSILLIVTDLPPTDYGVYTDNKYHGLKSKLALETGLKLDLKPICISEEWLRYLSDALPRLHAVTQSTVRKNVESGVVYDRLSTVERWIRDRIRAEQIWKSVSVRLVPFGSRTQGPDVSETPSPEKQTESLEFDFFNIHRVRGLIAGEIKDRDLRDRALSGLTPVDLELIASEKMEQGATVEATVRITNRIDLPISGRLAIDAPVGWKIESKGNSQYSELGMGQSAEAKFVVSIAQDATVGEDVALPATEINIPERTYKAAGREFEVRKIAFRMNSKTVVPVAPGTPQAGVTGRSRPITARPPAVDGELPSPTPEQTEEESP